MFQLEAQELVSTVRSLKDPISRACKATDLVDINPSLTPLRQPLARAASFAICALIGRA